MPVPFIMSGIILIALNLKLINCKSAIKNKLSFFLIFILISYLFSFVEINEIAFNFFQVFVILLILAKLLSVNKMSFVVLLTVIISSLLFVLFKATVDNYFNVFLLFSFSIICPLLVFDKRLFIFEFVINSIVLYLIQVVCEYNNFSMVVVDFNYVFEALIIGASFYLILWSIYGYLNSKKVGLYEKTDCSYFAYNASAVSRFN